MSTAAVFVPAYAKINLTLSVLGRRNDGFHSLASVMQTISLHDTLRIQTRPVSADSPATSFVCDQISLQTSDNLVMRAIELLRREYPGRIPTIEAELRKETPTQGGLGGGSSDAATTLATLNALLDLGATTTRLEELAARLGSDTAYLVAGGTASIAGRGEFVQELPDIEPLWIVLVKPPVAISTAAVFRLLTPANYGDASDTEAIVDAIRAGKPLPFDKLANTLESVVFSTYVDVARARDQLLELGAPFVRMSGSGPSLFTAFRTLGDASALYERAAAANLQAWLCHTVSRTQVLTSRLVAGV